MKKTLALIFLLLASFGCRKAISFEDRVRNKIKESVEDIYIEGHHAMEWRNRNKELSNLIRSDTNSATRINLYSLWGDAILAAKMPIPSDDYHSLARILGRVNKLVDGDVTLGLKNCQSGVEALFDMRLKLIEWQKKIMDELLVAEKEIDKNDEYRAKGWRYSYSVVLGGYTSIVDRLEGWWIPYEFEFYKVPKNVRGRIRAKIEKSLGRKIRSPEEALKNRDWADIYHKAWNKELP
jgi:hypothetical protein